VDAGVLQRDRRLDERRFLRGGAAEVDLRSGDRFLAERLLQVGDVGVLVGRRGLEEDLGLLVLDERFLLLVGGGLVVEDRLQVLERQGEVEDSDVAFPKLAGGLPLPLAALAPAGVSAPINATPPITAPPASPAFFRKLSRVSPASSDTVASWAASRIAPLVSISAITFSELIRSFLAGVGGFLAIAARNPVRSLSANFCAFAGAAGRTAYNRKPMAVTRRAWT
jgi:hypothetical protein